MMSYNVLMISNDFLWFSYNYQLKKRPVYIHLSLRAASLNSLANTMGGWSSISMVLPMSILREVAERNCNLILFAMVGPLTMDHHEVRADASSCLVQFMVSCMCPTGKHLAHTAITQCLIGQTCASNTGSSVPYSPSNSVRM